MTRTPDEIKKGLECCAQSKCGMGECSYYCSGSGSRCIPAMCADALALIQQLQAELEDMTARYKIADDCAKKKGEMNEKLYAELAAVKTERDAAVKSLRGRCFECKHNKTSVCLICSKDKSLKYWEWRGVQKEDSDAVSS